LRWSLGLNEEKVARPRGDFTVTISLFPHAVDQSSQLSHLHNDDDHPFLHSTTQREQPGYPAEKHTASRTCPISQSFLADLANISQHIAAEREILAD
jgi:hypothetical protein